ncbi:translation initiation factor IF-2-like isoform X4 [Ailuropoda melanoleuca]|uniref:translation initiation factor IF-2-like isoform X4 n=1 Tax=Ailuropoda melanoleuca TaxID=9646 RepID=UPI0014940403|nr:translation initiation factor IF-2-like isoform X4 [Ailuropoda melanoleuca]
MFRGPPRVRRRKRGRPFWARPRIRRAGRGRQGALPEPRARSRCGFCGKSASGRPRCRTPRSRGRKGGSVQLRSSPRAEPSSLPHLPGARVSRDLNRAEPRPAAARTPALQLPVRGDAHVVRPTSHPRGGSGGRPTQERKLVPPRARAPTHRGASLALPRVPMATAGAPVAASPSAPGRARRGAAHRRHCRRRRPQSPSAPGRPPAALRAGEPARGAPAGTKFLCARPLALTRARTLARTNHLTRADAVGGGNVWRAPAPLRNPPPPLLSAPRRRPQLAAPRSSPKGSRRLGRLRGTPRRRCGPEGRASPSGSRGGPPRFSPASRGPLAPSQGPSYLSERRRGRGKNELRCGSASACAFQAFLVAICRTSAGGWRPAPCGRRRVWRVT